MRVSRYIILLLAPVPVLMFVAYQVSSFIHSHLIHQPPPPGKELARLPDLQFKEAEQKKGVLDMIGLIDVRGWKLKETPAQLTEKEPERPPSYRVTFTYVGPRKSYAIINGRLFKEGDPVSPAERIVKITREGVLLSGRWGERWLPVVR